MEKYLGNKLGDALEDTRAAMRVLADTYTASELEHRAYRLYVAFRPDIPSGKQGWGAKGGLSLDTIRRLADDAG